MARVRGSANRTCIVCGHNLGPYGRICDKCGSIQRPVRGDGRPLPPDRYKACQRCGEPIPVESQEDICENCASIEEPHPVVWVEDEDPHGKARRAAMISSGVSLAATGGMALGVIFAGAQVILIVLLGMAVVAFGVSMASWMVISRRPAHKIEYFPPIKPEQQAEVKSSRQSGPPG
jgi:hypothetical protein